MGNCIHIPFSPSQGEVRVLIFNGGEKKFRASTPIKKIASGPYSGYKLVHPAQPNSPLPHSAKLIPGEVYYLLPHQKQFDSGFIVPKMSGKKTSRRQFVKIVLTREQLELLLGNVKEFQSKNVYFRFSENFSENQKLKPSLAVIPEVENF